MATIIGTQGSIDTSSALVGDWSDVNFIAFTGNISYNIGSVKESVLELTREDFQHVGTALPRIVDYLVPIRAGMRFTGNAEEHHKRLYHALIGDTIGATSNYIYPGVAQCNQFFTLHCRRTRACDAWVIEAKIFKVSAGGLISIGSSDESVGTPMELEGLDDQANASGQGGSAAAPLGYLWLPTETAAVINDPAYGPENDSTPTDQEN